MAVFRLRKTGGGSTVRGGDRLQSLDRVVTGVLLSRSPTFPIGAVNATNTLTGVLLARSPTFPTGTVSSEITLAGVLLTRSPTFPTGTVTPGPVTVTGLLLARSPTFPTGAVTLIVVGQIHPDAPLFAVLVSSPALAELTERGFSVAELDETGSIAELDETKTSA